MGYAFDKLSGNGNFTLGIFNENVAKWVPRTLRRGFGVRSEGERRWTDFDVTLWMRFDMTNMCVGHRKHSNSNSNKLPRPGPLPKRNRNHNHDHHQPSVIIVIIPCPSDDYGALSPGWSTSSSGDAATAAATFRICALHDSIMIELIALITDTRRNLRLPAYPHPVPLKGALCHSSSCCSSLVHPPISIHVLRPS